MEILFNINNNFSALLAPLAPPLCSTKKKLNLISCMTNLAAGTGIKLPRFLLHVKT